jgi:sialidase-1
LARRPVFLASVVWFCLWPATRPSASGSSATTKPSRSPIVETDVFVAGADGYHTFRIPALIVARDGSLLAFCEGRKSSRNDDGDIDLVLKRSEDGGRSWSGTNVVCEEGGDKPITIGNPCPVVDRATGVMWLALCRNNDRVWIMSSGDDGKSWSIPQDITATVKRPGWTWYATGPGVGIQLERPPYRDRLVIPCDHRESYEGRLTMFSHVVYSDDHGKTWRLGGSVAPHTDECQAVELDDGRLMLNMRNYWGLNDGRPERGKMRAVAYSADGGLSWTQLTFDAKLIEPVCQASLIRLFPTDSDEGGLVFSNPASQDQRVRMTVRLSRDRGKSWIRSRVLCPGPAAYSCLTAISADGTIGCLYETGRSSPYEVIRFARFPRQWLLESTGED